MIVLKRLLLFLGIFLLIYFIIRWFAGLALFKPLSGKEFWFILLGFVVAGELFGLLFYRIAVFFRVRKDEINKTPFLVSGHIFSLLVFLTIALFSLNAANKETAYKKKFGNIDSNRRIMRYFVNDNEEYIRTAFAKLESQFKDPNILELDAFSVHKTDTSLNYLKDTLYTVWFTYFLGSNKKDTLFSKLNIFRNSARIELFNISTNKDKEYEEIKEEKEKQKNAIMQDLYKNKDNIYKAIEHYTDSIRAN